MNPKYVNVLIFLACAGYFFGGVGGTAFFLMLYTAYHILDNAFRSMFENSSLKDKIKRVIDALKK